MSSTPKPQLGSSPNPLRFPLSAVPPHPFALIFRFQASEHGACPVIEGQKWAANLWVWNGPRYGLSSIDPETGRTIDKVTNKGGQAVEADPTFQVRKKTRKPFLSPYAS